MLAHHSSCIRQDGVWSEERYVSFRTRRRPCGLLTNYYFAYLFSCLSKSLVAAAVRHKTWRVAGVTGTVEDRWGLVYAELNSEPQVRALGDKPLKNLVSRFNQLVRVQTAKNNDAARASGVGNTSGDDLDGDEAKLVRS